MQSYIIAGTAMGLSFGSWVSEYIFNRLATRSLLRGVHTTDFSKFSSPDQVMSLGENQLDHLIFMYYISIVVFGIIGGFVGYCIWRKWGKSNNAEAKK